MRSTGLLLAAILLLPGTAAVAADPQADRLAFQRYFSLRFPDFSLATFSLGVYALDENLRQRWEDSEEFPPYETAIAAGRQYFLTAFANGGHLGDCFGNAGIGVGDRYPYFDVKRGEVITLELAINECLASNNEKPLAPNKGMIAAIEAYMAFTSRGKIIAVTVPDDARAQEAYAAGRRFFYARRGQLNMACAHCHVDYSGRRMNGELLSPALGQIGRFPVYRSEWNEVGTLHRRFRQCTELMQARPFDAQSPEYRNLEYFLGYMNNGLALTGPATSLMANRGP